MTSRLVPLFCIVALGGATAACGGKNKDKGTKLMKQETSSVAIGMVHELGISFQFLSDFQPLFLCVIREIQNRT